MNSSCVIAIDGSASSGKDTVVQALSRKLGARVVCEVRDICSPGFAEADFKFYLKVKHEKVSCSGTKGTVIINTSKKTLEAIISTIEYKVTRKLAADKAALEKSQIPKDFRLPWGANFLRKFLKMLILIPYRLIFWTTVINRSELRKHKGNGVIFCLNHRSNSDVPTLFLVFPGWKLHFMGKESLFKQRTIFNWFLRSLNGVPVRKGNDLSLIRHFVNKIKKNEVLLIFPEGRRNFSAEDALALRNGTAMIAIKSGAPIVPMVTNRRPRPFVLNRIKIGKTIQTDKYKGNISRENLNTLSAEMHDAMSRLLDGFEVVPRLKKWERESVGNVRAVIFIGDKLVAIKRQKNDQRYYVFPGGHVDKDEKPRNAVIRELKEETNVDALVTRELYRKPHDGCMQSFFLCEYKGGTVSKTDAEEYAAEAETSTGHDGKPRGTYDPVLIDIKDLQKIDLRPAHIKEQLVKDIGKYGMHLTRLTKYLK